MVRKIFCLFLVMFTVHSALAKVPEKGAKNESNLVGFCKELVKMVNGGFTTDRQVSDFIDYHFQSRKSSELSLIQLKSKTKEMIAGASNEPDEALNQCNDAFEKEFTNFAQRVVSKNHKFNIDDNTLTHEQVEKGHKIINGGYASEDPGSEFIGPIQIQNLCPNAQKETCDDNIPNSIKVLDDVVSYNNPTYKPFSTEDCDCFDAKTKLNKENILSRNTNVVEEMDHVILKAAGSNFLNQYASFYEDLKFYDNMAWALKEKKSGKEAKISGNVLCVDPALFKKSIDATCEKNGTTAGKDERVAELLGSMGNNFSGGSNSFNSNFSALVNDIDTTPINIPNTISGLTGLPDFKINHIDFKRADFEKVRFGYAQGLPEVGIVDEMIGIIVRDKELKALLDVSLQNKNYPKTPLAAIEEMLTVKGTDSKIVSKVIRKLGHNKKNNSTIKLLTDSIDNGNFNSVRENVFKVGLTTHPGLKNLLLDADFFNKAQGNLTKNDKGIVRQAQRNRDFMNHFTDRCKGLQEKLAEAVCARPADLKYKVNTNDMVELLKGKDFISQKTKEEQLALNLLLCSMNKNQVPSKSVFGGLTSNAPFTTSDFKDRKINMNPGKQKNMFTAWAKEMVADPKFKEQQEKVASSAAYASVSSGQLSSSGTSSSGESDSLASGMFQFEDLMGQGPSHSGKQLPTISSGTSNTTHKEESTVQSQFDNISEQITNIMPVNNTVQPTAQYANNFASPTTKTAEVKEFAGNEEQVSPVREELKNSMKGRDQKQLDGFLHNISDADAKELLRLRAESKKGQEEISDLRLEQERLKTQELKAQFEALEKKLELLNKEKNSVANNNSSGFSKSGGYQESKQEQDEGFSNFGGKTNSTNFQATGGSTSGHSASGGGNTLAQGQLREPSSNSNAAAGRDLVGKTGETSLVIKSQASNGQASAEDPSGELITYLTKNETDSKTLRDLKESGLIYTYEVNENGTTVHKKKMIKYTELSAEAKALVDKKISILVKKESADIERQITSLKRTYSIQALKLEILSHRGL